MFLEMQELKEFGFFDEKCTLCIDVGSEGGSDGN